MSKSKCDQTLPYSTLFEATQPVFRERRQKFNVGWRSVWSVSGIYFLARCRVAFHHLALSPSVLQRPGTQHSKLGSHSPRFAMRTFTCSVVVKQTRTQPRVLCCTFKSWWPWATFASCLQSSPEDGMQRLPSEKYWKRCQVYFCTVPLTFPSSCFSPSRSKHHWLKCCNPSRSLQALHVLLIRFLKRITVFSTLLSLAAACLISWRANYCPLSAGKVYLRGGRTCQAASSTPPKRSEKCYLHAEGERSQTEGRQERFCIRSHPTPNGIHFFEFLVYNWWMNAAFDVLWKERVSVWVTHKLSNQRAEFTTSHHSPVDSGEVKEDVPLK